MIAPLVRALLGKVLIGVAKYRDARNELLSVAERLALEAGYTETAATTLSLEDARKMRAAAEVMRDASARVYAVERSIRP